MSASPCAAERLRRGDLQDVELPGHADNTPANGHFVPLRPGFEAPSVVSIFASPESRGGAG